MTPLTCMDDFYRACLPSSAPSYIKTEGNTAECIDSFLPIVLLLAAIVTFLHGTWNSALFRI